MSTPSETPNVSSGKPWKIQILRGQVVTLSNIYRGVVDGIEGLDEQAHSRG